jgi:hypothetical protein
MANEYNYERYNPERKKKSQYQFGGGTLEGIGQTLLTGPLALFTAPHFIGEGIKKDTQTWDDPEQALQIEKENRRRAALANLPTRGPEMTSDVSNRIAAWQQESAKPTDTSYFDKQVHEGPLATDTRFQRDQNLISAGAASQAANVVNRQAATGTRGGFQNVGSIADVYDRLGTQLAGLGQRQQELNQNIRQQKFGYMEQERARKEQLADRAAQAKQQFLDSQIAHDNMLKQARGAIETGDIDLGMKLIGDADKLRREQQLRYEQFWGNVLGGVVQAAGAAAGGPAGGTAAGAIGGAIGRAARYQSPEVASATPYTEENFTMPTFGSSFPRRRY